jgi:hypothetical protein
MMKVSFLSTILSSLAFSTCFSQEISTSQTTRRTTTMNPVTIKGYKFFDSMSGEEVVFRGIAYNPRPNNGTLNHNSMDFYTAEHSHLWQRDLKYLKQLGVNAVRLYAVDPEQDHAAFMCALQQHNIYVVVELASACSGDLCAITRDQAPDCYPVELKQRGQAIVKEFSKYTNTLAFSTGNEVNHFAPPNTPEWNGPCQKKFLRDMRYFMEKECASTLRKIPIGLVAADSDRDANAMYYNCISDKGDEYEAAEWYGLNSYVSCDGTVDHYQDASGFVSLQQSFASYNYSIPVLLTEFGCLSETFPTIDAYEGQRDFRQAKWLWTEPDVREQFAGGFVFEYSIEKENAQSESPYPFAKFGKQNYGVGECHGLSLVAADHVVKLSILASSFSRCYLFPGYFSPKACNDVTIPCQYNPRPEFYMLKKAYDITQKIVTNSSSQMSTTMEKFEIPLNRQGRSRCPEQFPPLDKFSWKVDHTKSLSCPSKQETTFMCPANLDDLIKKTDEHGKADTTAPSRSSAGGMDPAAATGIFFVVVLVVLILIRVVRRRSKSRAALDEPWTSLVIPMSLGRSDSNDESDESTGLMSMQNVGRGGFLYRAINSDSSLEEFDRYGGGTGTQSA